MVAVARKRPAETGASAGKRALSWQRQMQHTSGDLNCSEGPRQGSGAATN
jgi:hypothetical protein